MKKRAYFIALIGLLWSTTALAQQPPGDDGNTGDQVRGQVSTSLIALMPTTSTCTSGYFSIGMEENKLEKNIKRLESIVKLQRYLKVNERQVRMALTIGGGETMRELSILLRVKYTPKFAKQMRKKRKTLNTILNQPDSFAKAASFFDTTHLAIFNKPFNTKPSKGGKQ